MKIGVTYCLQLNPKYFPLPLKCEWLDGKRWKLLSPFKYIDDNGEVTIAEKDFITDFGSKPWWCWILVGAPTDEAGPAYVIHDWDCFKHLFSYPIIDAKFYRSMGHCDNLKQWKRWLMYRFVRLWHICE